MSNLIYKAKAAVTGHHSTSTNAGPHDTNIANKADPCVDSDIDHRNNATSTMGSSTSGMGTTTMGTKPGSTNAGPHSSNIMNKLDPNVDSDLDHRKNPTSTMANSTSGYGSSTTGTTAGSTNAGPHSSNLMNKVDPRVDSDLDGCSNCIHTNAMSAGNTGYDGTCCGNQSNCTRATCPKTATTIGHHTSTNAGPHSSNLMNKADPRVDSDCSNPTSTIPGSKGYGTTSTGTGTGTTTHHTSTTTSTGNAHQTANPHNSNLLNKLDPRANSGVDSSETYGGVGGKHM